MALAEQPSLTTEAADQAFASQETADQAGSCFRDLELQRVFERDNVAGIHDVFAVHFNFIDGSEAA